VTEPYELGLLLGIKEGQLDRIERDNKKSDEQMDEVIKYWLDKMSPSWEALADAVTKMESYGNLAKELKQQHKRLQANTNKSL
jgi:hypothetical protein